MESSSRDHAPDIGSALEWGRRAGQLLWDNSSFVAAGFFALRAVAAPSAEAGVAVLFAVMLGCEERSTRFWRRMTYKWKAVAELAISRLSSNTLNWSDFCQRVRDNLPDAQAEAVQAALELAIAPSLSSAKPMPGEGSRDEQSPSPERNPA